ncbi:MAG TPA: spermidine/putrescine ABC transporter substrate-binding protein, partial [Nitrospiraceae bacterium]|nr:spermidine/putrescine ABC transporter substrate-binding protein [Nitrospiraceae bacterium]
MALTLHQITKSPKRTWLAVVLIASLIGCQPAPEDARKPTLYYFTWSDYAGPDVVDEFEKAQNVKVVVDTFGSNEELLAKLQSGAAGYDVAVPSDFMVSIMAAQGLLAELDVQKIPNAGHLLDRLQHLPFDPSNRHSIPYLWGTVGIGYDSEKLSGPPDSWAVLWDPRYKGKISMLNDQREVLGVALRSIGRSLNSTDPQSIDEAKRLLLAQKPLVKAYTSENYTQLLASGEVLLAHGWGGAVARATVDRPSIKYVVPKEGGTIWADCLVVLQSSKNKDLAMRFINHLLDQEVAARTTNRLLFASSNRDAKDLLKPEFRDNPAIYPPDSVFEQLEWMHD